MAANTDWGSSYATAGVDAMTAYDDILVPRVFDPFADVLLDKVDLSPGLEVLDVACGPGTIARRVAQRLGPSGGSRPATSVRPCWKWRPPNQLGQRGTDLVPAVPGRCDRRARRLLRSRALPAGPAVLPGPARRPGRVAASPEAGRASRVAVWCAIEECPFWDELASAVGPALGRRGNRFPQWPMGAPRSRRADPTVRRRRVLRRERDPPVLPVVFEGGAAQLVASLEAASVGPQIAALDADGRAALLAAAEATLAPFVHNGELRSEAATHIVVAAR